MKKARYVNSKVIEIIDYDAEIKRIECEYVRDVEDFSVEEAEENKAAALSLLSDYLEFVPSEVGKIGEFETASSYYVVKGKKIYQKWSIEKGNEDKILSKITELKAELEKSDYKITKCYEATLLSEDMPYDVQALVSERQTKRDEINRLEELLTPEA